MVPEFDTKRLLRESAPAGVVLAFWTLLARFANHFLIGDGLLAAGVVMALLYVVVRGVALAGERPWQLPTDVGGLLRTNARVLFAAGTWFLAAIVVAALDVHWRLVGLPGLFTSPVEGLVFVLTGTGVATIVLVAVAVGASTLRAGGPSAVPADD